MLYGRMDSAGGAAVRHVGLPRTLDVQQFAAARASEVQVLYNALKVQQEDGKISLTTPRHLRRRTTSHNRRLPFRWRSNAAGKSKKDDRGTLASSSRPQHDVISTTQEETSRKRKSEKQFPCRRVRRRIELQRVREGTASFMRDGNRRLATHVWHAKRFQMTKTWGYCLPQGLPGRGRGSKSVFKWVKEAAVLHDASYNGLIELQGTQGAILRALGQTLEPPPGASSSGLRGKEEETHGLLYGNAVLHNFGKAPLQPIAPVTILWRPSSSSKGVETSKLSTIGEGAGDERQLWIWVHPGAFDKALLALSTACERQASDDIQKCVKCRPRSGDLARFDIIGRRALQVLQKVLRPVPRKLAHLSSSAEIEGGSGLDSVNTDVTTTAPPVSRSLSARIFAKADCLPAAAVLALDVYDPRETPRCFYSGTNINLSGSSPDGIDDSSLPGDDPSLRNRSMDEEAVLQDSKPPIDSTNDIGVTDWENLVDRGLNEEVSDSPYLWSPQAERKLGALSQKAFSQNRHKRRKIYLSGVDNHVLRSSWEEGAQQQSGACPVLLLKHAHPRDSASGWSVILPVTWVQAFWVPLVFAGGHVIGLRERHWLATDAGFPNFPHDFPDCPTHAQHLAILNAAFDSANQARPPFKKSPSFAVSPLQRSILFAYNGHMLSSTRRTAADPSELIDEELDKQRMKANGTTPVGDLRRPTDVDGGAAVTESLEAREPSPPVGLIVSSELRTVDGDTEQAAAGKKSTSLAVLSEGCEIVEGENFPKPNSPLAENSASLNALMSDTVPSVEGSFHGREEEIVSGFANTQGDTPMAGTRSLALPAGGKVMDGLRILQRTFPIGNAFREGSSYVQDRGPSLQLQSVDGTLNPKFANLDEDLETHLSEAPIMSSSESPAPCQTVGGAFIPDFPSLKGNTCNTVELETIPKTDDVHSDDGVIVPELTEALGHTAASEVKSLPDKVPFLAVAIPDVDKTVALEVTYLDEYPEVVAAGIDVARSPSSEIPCEPAVEGTSLQPLTKPHDNDTAILDNFPQHIRRSSSAPSQSKRPKFEAHETVKIKSERCGSWDKAISPEQTSGPRPIELQNLEVSEVLGNVTDFLPRSESSSLGGQTCLGLASNMNATTGSPTLPFFVARTVEALMKVVRECGLQNALLLCSGLLNCRSVQHGLKKGTLEWRPSQNPVEPLARTGKVHAMVGEQGTACYVRVLIKVPMKGVLKENGVLCRPTKADFDAFLSRSQHWQGVEASWLNPQAKAVKRKEGKRKQKGLGKQIEEAGKSPAVQSVTNSKAQDAATSAFAIRDGAYDECCSREAIGCITSTGPQGSFWSGTGICEVTSLMKLRAMQWQDQRWWKKKEVLVLAGNRLSPILRPVMVSIVLELGQGDRMWS